MPRKPANTAPAPLEIANRDARRLLLHLQGLSAPPRRRLDADGLYDLIHSLGFVQLDSINTVERAHHMILHSRSSAYRHADLAHLHETRGDLFEHWTHDASLIPTEFFPHWHHRFARARQNLAAERWRKRLGPDGPKVIRAVKGRIAREGPLLSRDFEDAEGRKGKGAWWGWGASKTALEYLWRTGELAIARREGFQKVYDLTERVIPDELRARKPSRAESLDWKCRAALDRLGLATPGEIAAFWDSVSPKDAAAWAKPLIGSELVEIAVANADGSPPRKALAYADIEDRLAAAPKPPAGLRLLSPFDPLIRDRARLSRLFGFDYRIEVFVPENKREYGYYVLPILEGGRLTARADLKAHRKDGVLELKGLWLEPGVPLSAAREAAIRKALARLARFTGVEKVAADRALQRPKAARAPHP